MSIDYPTYDEIINRIRADVLNGLPEVDATIYGSVIRALVDGLGGRSLDHIVLLQQLEKQSFPQTSTDEYVERWSGYEDLERFAAEFANGGDNISVTGTPGTTLPKDKTLVTENGDTYVTTTAATISSNVVSIVSLVISGQIVTATFSVNHNLATTNQLTIAGANETEYNGTHTITVISALQLQYTIVGSPSSPATGTIAASYNNVVSSVKSVKTGEDQNVEPGGRLTLSQTLSGVDSNLYVTFEGITGGLNVETDERLLIRTLSSRSNPVANFNVGAITKQAFSVSGVTRILVKRITPSIGSVTVLFVRDDDDTIIPNAAEVAEVKAALVEILQASSSESKLIVQAPIPIITNYVFSSISPDSTEMRAAIETNLNAFYGDSVLFETPITQDSYKSAIIETVDPSTGDKLQSFTLTSPITDITVTTYELGILGDITF